MENQPMTLRDIFQSIAEWFVEAGRWMVVTFNRILFFLRIKRMEMVKAVCQ